MSPIAFEIEWEEAEPRGSAEMATTGELRAYVDGSLIWGTSESGFPWSWIELLEYLSRVWPYLEFEETDPLGLSESPDRLRSLAERRWEMEPPHQRAEEERLLWEFEDSHNLARALQGAWLPDLWLLRQGERMSVVAGGRRYYPSAAAVLESLEAVGQQIVSRLKSLDDERAVSGVRSWEGRRLLATTEEFVSIATSLPRGSLERISGSDDLKQFWEIGDKPEPTELLAAARLIGDTLFPEDIREFFAVLRKIPARDTSELDRLSSLADDQVAAGTEPYDQGYELAKWLRSHTENTNERFDPEEQIASWGIPIQEVGLMGGFDAVCVWGPRHGPIVFLNQEGEHSQGEAGRRSTLAHEMCHLLIDRRGALPLAEVLGGRTPERLEKRARAFAAELLIPREIAGAEFSKDVDPRAKMREMTERFGVSREIVAWQARNSRAQLHYRAQDFLRRMVTYPERF